MVLLRRGKETKLNTKMSLLTTILKVIGPMVPTPMVERGLREYFNNRFKSLGTMTKLQIDSTNKKATLELDLKGETQPLQITINRYELTTVGGKMFIEIKEFETSREWINSLAKPLLKGKTFEVPELAKAIL
ncbi:MAG: hypothetical protein JWR26_4997 [Pedosphaera sp.]|nr:hypothetical protein [Pedosphaera sp.]